MPLPPELKTARMGRPTPGREKPMEEGKPREASPLLKAFVVILLGFAVFSIFLNHQYTRPQPSRNSMVGSVLKDFKVSKSKEFLDRLRKDKELDFATDAPSDEEDDDDDDVDEDSGDDKVSGEGDDDGSKEGDDEIEEIAKPSDAALNNEAKQQQQKQQQQEHTIANLNCQAYGGPSNKDAEEMVYWEDIPKDALHMSPFHKSHPQNKEGPKKITQFLTFEPDHGGWNNIRMAMETVLAMSFAMGRTLVLPPHQGMYLIDKGGNKQKNKFSFDHFFHMESISNEHIGLDIISTTEFLEMCARGDIVDTNGNPIVPPDGRTNWDGAPQNERAQLMEWLRSHADENLIHYDPDHCIVAFPATNSEADAKELASLPERIQNLPGSWPHHEQYVGKPQAIDAPAIDRLKEINADRGQLCLYTPQLQQKQWIHFPVGMKTPDGDTSRLLVHFYAFLFFQDWKQDLWMKRFVRDHVRYIDEIQCAAARVVTKLRQRVRSKSNGVYDKFDTIHVRRGDFQYHETRVGADKILESLRKVLSQNTTLYIATDERDKSFFQPIVDYFADVAFLDDFVESELQDINTNYFGMIDQLVSSRGEIFFGCWFSTFTGYINRLRGYHTDDHELPGFEDGIIPSYYYAGPEPDRFSHMREYWPVKQQFYAREFPTSWRLIDHSI